MMNENIEKVVLCTLDIDNEENILSLPCIDVEKKFEKYVYTIGEYYGLPKGNYDNNELVVVCENISYYFRPTNKTKSGYRTIIKDLNKKDAELFNKIKVDKYMYNKIQAYFRSPIEIYMILA